MTRSNQNKLLKESSDSSNFTDLVTTIPHLVGVVLANKSNVEKILKGSLDSILSPSPSVKIQIMGGKICLRC